MISTNGYTWARVNLKQCLPWLAGRVTIIHAVHRGVDTAVFCTHVHLDKRPVSFLIHSHLYDPLSISYVHASVVSF